MNKFLLKLFFFMAFCSIKTLFSKELTMNLFTKKNAFDSAAMEILITKENIFAQINKLISENYLCWQRKDDCTSYFIIHGFIDNSEKKWIKKLKDEFFIRHQESSLINVFTIDWPSAFFNFKYPNGTYNWNPYRVVVESNLPRSATLLNELTSTLLDLKYLKQNETTLYLHCIGHSLGAHMCGLFAKQLFASRNIKPRRITGLDPASFYFKKNNNKRLFKGDALFVDIIHTNTFVFGLKDAIGDVDFYPNGGSWQPGCLDRIGTINAILKEDLLELLFIEALNEMCNHGRACEFFTDSINKCKLQFKAYKCNDYSAYLNGQCDYWSYNYMGLDALLETSEKKFHLETTATTPFCYSQTCTIKNKPGYCAYGKEKKGQDCIKLNHKECGNNNRFSCCLNKKSKLTQKDLTIVIDSSSRSSEEFEKAIDFAAGFIRNAEISLDSTRVAIISYSSTNAQTLSFLNQNNSQDKLLNILNSIPIESVDQESIKSNPPLIKALQQSLEIYKVENGMRELNKGVDKQVIFISGEEIKKNEQAKLIVKELGTKGELNLVIELTKTLFSIL